MAGAGKKTFTAGEVLTASDVNTYLMEQSVMVFGGTAARSSAIPTPSTGMTSYIGVTGTATIPQIETYTGSAWQTPYGSTLLANVSFTSATTVNVDNVFTTQYANYQIVFTPTHLGANSYYGLKLRASGVDSTTGYYGGGWLTRPNFSGVSDYRINNSTDFLVGGGTTSMANTFHNLLIASPRISGVFTGLSTNGIGVDASSSYGYALNAWVNETTAFDGFRIYTVAGSITGSIRVYGLRNS